MAKKEDLSSWSKEQVTAWLTELKTDAELDFDVSLVTARGDLFASRNKADFVDFAGGVVGINIFHAKEALSKKEASGGVNYMILFIIFL